MPRLFTEPTLLIASGNKGKVTEIRELLEGFPLEVRDTNGLQIEEPDETADSFIGNAILKACYYGKAANLPSLADDSGLVVEGLNGAPGIYSARWGGPTKDFNIAMERVRTELGDNPSRNAYFACALALYWPDGHTEAFEGQVHGTLTFPPRGEKGFGYDPIFIPNGYNVTFAEMEAAEKHKISHRADAFRQLMQGCFMVRV